jgi:light-regulated signal transduction histidine kinase (bacteriophytochrome)
MPNGEIHPMKASVLLNTTEDEHGVITGYVIDLTEFKMTDAGMEQIKNMNKEATNKFTHELAGILASIQTYTLLLSRKTKDFHDEEINQLIESLSQLSKESVHLVRNYKEIGLPGDDLLQNPN